jgi:hypothetical protein
MAARADDYIDRPAARSTYHPPFLEDARRSENERIMGQGFPMKVSRVRLPSIFVVPLARTIFSRKTRCGFSLERATLFVLTGIASSQQERKGLRT